MEQSVRRSIDQHNQSIKQRESIESYLIVIADEYEHISASQWSQGNWLSNLSGFVDNQNELGLVGESTRTDPHSLAQSH